MSLASILAGKKTYITAASGALLAAAAAANGNLTPGQAGVAILTSLLATFVRSGSKADAAKATIETAAAVTATLAPVIAVAVPASAKVVDVAGEIAGDVAQLG